MTFDGAFHIPRWVLGFPEQGRADALIGHCQLEEGIWPSANVNAGAKAFAGWIVADPARAKCAASLATGVLFMGAQVSRMLAGIALPSPEDAALIEEATGGAVVWDAWNRPEPIDVAAIKWNMPERSPLDRPSDDRASATDTAWAVLGETPSGPLFRVTKVERVVEVEGFGLTLRTSVAAAAMLRDGLTRALGC